MPSSNPNANDPAPPATYFASPQRATPQQVVAAVAKLSNNPLLDAAMQSLGGWVCVVNECRQILAVNHALMEALGVADPAAALGLRPGEVLRCVHAHDHPAGCGTGRFCATCGAAVAMVAAQDTRLPQQLECVLTSDKGDTRVDHDFVVSCTPFQVDNEPLLLICMRDVSEEKRRVAMERAFLHDAGNLLSALSMGAHAMSEPTSPADAESLAIIRQASASLIREIRIQRLLAQDNPRDYPVEIRSTSIRAVVEQVRDLMTTHSAGRGQRITMRVQPDEIALQTDVGLLSRVLANMVLNALEAGDLGEEVRITARASAGTAEFSVWNHQSIPDPVAMRVFQRYFSTKPGGGRGLGTYTMKLLGEKLLGGDVSFVSTPAAGTTFRIRLPCTFRSTPRNPS